MNRLELSYITPQRGREYQFLQVPLLLFQHRLLKDLSPAAKITYSFLLRRVGLSSQHPEEYTDEQGHLYIIYPREDLAADIQINADSATKYLKQLEEIGLINQKRRGQGKPSLIYVMDFTSISLEESAGNEDIVPSDSTASITGETAPVSETEDVGFKKPKVSVSRDRKIPFQEAEGFGFKRPKGSVSRNREFPFQETEGFGTRDKDLKEIDLRENLSFPPNLSDGGKEEQDEPALDLAALEAEIREQIEFDVLLGMGYSEDLLTEVVRLIADTLCRAGPVQIGGGVVPEQAVKQRFRELAAEHIASALDCMDKAKDLRNPRAYLLALLYNAPSSAFTAQMAGTG